MKAFLKIVKIKNRFLIRDGGGTKIMGVEKSGWIFTKRKVYCHMYKPVMEQEAAQNEPEEVQL